MNKVQLFLSQLSKKPQLSLYYILIIIGILFSIIFFEQFTFDQYFDRDLTRARFLSEDFWIHGPEIFGGGRTPGFAYNVVLFIISKITFQNIPMIYCIYFFLYAISNFILAKIIYSDKNPLPSLLFLTFSFTHYFTYELSIALWNPTFAYPFISFSYYYFFKFLKSKKETYLLIALSLASCSISFHLSNAVLYLLFICILIIKRKTHTAMTKALLVKIIAVSTITYIPFIIHEINALINSQTVWVQKISIDSPLSLDVYLMKYLKVIANFLGITYFTNETGLQWNYREQFNHSSVSFYKYLLIFLTTLPFIYIIPHILKKIKRSLITTHLYTFFFLSSILCVFIFYLSYENDATNLRRFIWFYPIVLLLISQLLGESLVTVSRKKYIIFLLMLLSYSLAQHWYKTENLKNVPSIESYKFKKSIIQTLNKEFNYNYEEIRNRVSLISKKDLLSSLNSNYKLLSRYGDTTGVHSFFSSEPELKETNLSWHNKDCVFIISGKKGPTPSIEFVKNKIIAPIFKNDYNKNIQINKYHVSGDNIFVSTPAFNSNCPTYFRNFYLNPNRDIWTKEKLTSKNIMSKSFATDEGNITFNISKHNVKGSKYIRINIDTPYISTSIPNIDELQNKIEFTNLNSKIIYELNIVPDYLAESSLISVPVLVSINELPPGSYKLKLVIKDFIISDSIVID